jgi:hypothetical protein
MLHYEMLLVATFDLMVAIILEDKVVLVRGFRSGATIIIWGFWDWEVPGRCEEESNWCCRCYCCKVES